MFIHRIYIFFIKIFYYYKKKQKKANYCIVFYLNLIKNNIQNNGNPILG
jgi:hypothetical protein